MEDINYPAFDDEELPALKDEPEDGDLEDIEGDFGI